MDVIPLGGCVSFGRNLTAYVQGGRSVLIDCGVQLPDDLAPGIDHFVPDARGLCAHAPPQAIVLTHGHEDHIGAVPHLLRELGQALPVYGRPLTLRLLQNRLDDARIPRRLRDLRDLHPGQPVQLGDLQIEARCLPHSIPEACSLYLRGVDADGVARCALHTGDFKLDGGATLDELLGPRPALDLLVCDSTNAVRPGRAGVEARAEAALEEVLTAAPGRVAVALFSSHVERVRHFAEACVRAGRSLCLLGRGLHEAVRAAEELRLLRLPATLLCDEATAARLPPRRLALLCTGSQGEPDAALHRLAAPRTASARGGVHLQAGDRLVLAARTLPGSERPLGRILDRLVQRGVEVVSGPDYAISGHACQDELRELLRWARPRLLLPVHGTRRHTAALAALAQAEGVPSLCCEEGDVVQIGAAIQRHGCVPAGRLAVEGTTVGAVSHVTLRQRQALARAGLVVVAVDAGGAVMIDAVGVQDAGPALFALCTEAAARAEARLRDRPDDPAQAVRSIVRQHFYRARGVRPGVVVLLPNRPAGSAMLPGTSDADM